MEPRVFSRPDLKREIMLYAVTTVAALLLISALWLWFGGLHLLPGVLRNLPFGLLLSALITGYSTLVTSLALWIMRGRPVAARWAVYLAFLSVAAAAGTLTAPLVVYALGLLPGSAVLDNFWQNIRVTLVFTLAVGTLIVIAHEWRHRVEDLRAQASAATTPPPRVPSRVGGRVEFVDFAAVAYVYAQDKLTFAVTPAKHHALDLSIAELEQKVPAGRWLRIHRKTLLNLDAVRDLHTDRQGRLFVRVADGAELRVARDRAAQVRAALKG